MNISKRFRITIFVVLVLAVGLGVANLPFAGTTVARAAANFLSSVAHNSSLTGDGTTALPLGIANNGVGTNQLADNAVTSSKIASGQAVKSFNGLFDNVSLVAGSNVTLTPSGNTLTISSLLGLTSVSHDSSLTGDGTGTSPLGIASGQVTRSVNGLTDNVSLVAGDNVTITPSGNTLTIASSEPPQPYITPLRVATLQWYSVNETGLSYTIPSGAIDLAFDGANMWVVSNQLLFSTVTKLRASDGANLGTFSAGSENPICIAFDGANMWVSNGEDNVLRKIRTTDGLLVGSFPVGFNPRDLAFDGANTWVAHGSSSVTKLRASDGATLGTFSVGSSPSGIAFDGANIWVANSFSNTVTKLRASDGAVLGTFSVGERPRKVAFDGANIWVLNSISKTLTKLRASDGVNVGTFSVAASPGDIAFDGAHIWVTNITSVTKLRASDGANLGTFSVPQGAGGIAFDGANMWVTSGDTVTKL